MEYDCVTYRIDETATARHEYDESGHHRVVVVVVVTRDKTRGTSIHRGKWSSYRSIAYIILENWLTGYGKPPSRRFEAMTDYFGERLCESLECIELPRIK